ncbi:hypothetical protein M3J09_012202 [Ascochyta lentis]
MGPRHHYLSIIPTAATSTVRSSARDAFHKYHPSIHQKPSHIYTPTYTVHTRAVQRQDPRGNYRKLRRFHAPADFVASGMDANRYSTFGTSSRVPA